MSGLPEVGTLAQIGAQVGDVVEWLGPGGITRYKVTRISGSSYYNTNGLLSSVYMFRMIKRATPAAPPPMSRAEILTTAREIVTQNRQSSDASPEDSFGVISAMWSAYLDAPITAKDVAVMMGLVKIARIKIAPGHPDNWIDLAGYAACGGEIAMKGKDE